MYKRSLWPWFAWGSGVMFALSLGSMFAGLFIDGRWGIFCALSIPLMVAGIITTSIVAYNQVEYRAKPKNWRKVRAEYEREAYIKDLERELKYG